MIKNYIRCWQIGWSAFNVCLDIVHVEENSTWIVNSFYYSMYKMKCIKHYTVPYSATFFINILNSLNCVVKLCLHWNVVHIRCGWRTEVSCGDSDNKTWRFPKDYFSCLFASNHVVIWRGHILKNNLNIICQLAAYLLLQNFL